MLSFLVQVTKSTSSAPPPRSKINRLLQAKRVPQYWLPPYKIVLLRTFLPYVVKGIQTPWFRLPPMQVVLLRNASAETFCDPIRPKDEEEAKKEKEYREMLYRRSPHVHCKKYLSHTKSHEHRIYPYSSICTSSH